MAEMNFQGNRVRYVGKPHRKIGGMQSTGPYSLLCTRIVPEVRPQEQKVRVWLTMQVSYITKVESWIQMASCKCKGGNVYLQESEVPKTVIHNLSLNHM